MNPLAAACCAPACARPFLPWPVSMPATTTTTTSRPLANPHHAAPRLHPSHHWTPPLLLHHAALPAPARPKVAVPRVGRPAGGADSEEQQAAARLAALIPRRRPGTEILAEVRREEEWQREQPLPRPAGGGAGFGCIRCMQVDSVPHWPVYSALWAMVCRGCRECRCLGGGGGGGGCRRRWLLTLSFCTRGQMASYWPVFAQQPRTHAGPQSVVRPCLLPGLATG
jgi:hypothetical protein